MQGWYRMDIETWKSEHSLFVLIDPKGSFSCQNQRRLHTTQDTYGRQKIMLKNTFTNYNENNLEFYTFQVINT